jgi:sulfatase maturation enzyme AslB (radical SAM superfamily)
VGCRPEPMPVNRALPPIPQAVTRTEAAAVPWLSSEPARAETVAVGTVYLHVTRACNLRCSYCYFAASRPLPDEMSGEELTPVWPQLVALRPQKVVFTGGEPRAPDMASFFVWGQGWVLTSYRRMRSVPG